VAQPTDAQLAASQLGGNLLVLDDQAENDFIQQNISDLVYIGLNDVQSEGTPQWVNGNPLGFENFDICSFCNENSADMDYVVMHQWNGGWSWSNEFNQRKYIVEIPCSAASQCLINGITLTTQAEVNQFPINYPGCSAIVGDLNIEGGVSIVDLSPLSQITSVGGDVKLFQNQFLSDLTGLDNLTTVGGLLRISENDALTDLSKFNNITSVHSIQINHNLVLERLGSFHNIFTIEGDIDIFGNYEMVAADGLSALTMVEGEFDFSGNYNVTDISSFSNLTEVKGSFRIIEQRELTSMEGFDNLQSVGSFSLNFANNMTSLDGLESLNYVFGNVYIETNPVLTDMTALSGMTLVSGDIDIINNNSLVDLNGFQGMTNFLNRLKVGFNDALTSLNGLENITSKVSPLMIMGNNVLTDISTIQNMQLDVGLTITGNPQLAICHQPNVCSLLLNSNYSFAINNNAVGCETAAVVENTCSTLLQNPSSNYGSSLQSSGSSLLNEDRFSIYPNPAEHQIFIQINAFVRGKQTLEIFDARGVLVKTTQVDLYEGINSVEVSISDFADGIYFVKIPQENGEHISKRFVKITE